VTGSPAIRSYGLPCCGLRPYAVAIPLLSGLFFWGLYCYRRCKSENI